MINASEVVTALVEKLRDIPELVAEVGGDASNIGSYHANYSEETNLVDAIYKMPSPGVLIVWRGWDVGGFGSNDVFKHRFSVFLRAGQSVDDNPPNAYYKIARLIWSGIPASEAQPMKYLVLHDSLYPMDPPRGEFITDENQVEYFELTLTFTEKGDD